MIGAIQATNKSQSGKTIGVQVNNVWYTSKSWELEGAVGRNIIFEPSTQAFPDGGSCNRLNDYVFEEGNTGPAAQVMNQAMAQQPTTQVAPQSQYVPPSENPAPPRNKDSVIGALALVKATTGPKEQVWENFEFFYHKLESWDHTVQF